MFCFVPSLAQKLQNDTTWQDFVLNDDPCSAATTTAATTATTATSSINQCSTEESAAMSALAATAVPPVFTMLHPGAVLQARYSEYHTMRVQLQGSARYHLLPPVSAAVPMHLYPSIHRCAGQAQVIQSHFPSLGKDACSCCHSGCSSNLIYGLGFMKFFLFCSVLFCSVFL
jgi:hypothetical protein